MRAHALFSRAFQARVAQSNQNNDLGRGGSPAAGIAASTAAILLVIASAGFGATFALSQGLHHGPVLAAFALAMALGLECAKPFAVDAVFSSLRSWAIGRALAMTLLATVAIGYSLTAELSLMAMTRGDAAAGRVKVADSAKDDRAALAHIVAERSSMSFIPASEAAVSTAREAVAAAARTRAAECEQRGKNCRLRESEESTARQRLAEVIASREATDRAAVLDGKADAIRSRLATAPATAAADPGAAALEAYLGIFGVAVDASLLSQWLVLVGVVALEVGSALAVMLVRATGGHAGGRRAPVHEFPGQRSPIRRKPL